MIPDSIGTRACRPFREKLLSKHMGASKTLEAIYMKTAKRYTYVEANAALRDADETLSRHDLKLSMSDEELRQWCKRRAEQVQQMLGRFPLLRVEAAVRALLVRYSIQFPNTDVDLFGVESALRRCACEHWWRRRVRVLQARVCDDLARSYRLVHNVGQIYCSHHAVNLRRGQKVRNRKILSGIIAANEQGDEFTLAELSDLAVSNPKIRRAELMVRMRGFEELAKEQGRVGEFYTITCPSKFHATKRGGIPNDKYQGATVADSNAYLVGLWARLRAALCRRGIDPYGFRVAEPNHDGCPHWHILLFVRPSDVGVCRALFQSYALAEDGDEEGARRHRFTAVTIDPAKGSATGYIAKYISKNIDGHGVVDDLYGYDAKESAVRIEAWASTHGIRQFQQIGGPSVTVWRELRRLDSPEEGIIEQGRLAADASDWLAFCKLQGSGRDQSIGIGRWEEFCKETGEILCPVFNRYGEPAAARVFGLVAYGHAVLTRFYRWVLHRVDSMRRPVLSRPVPGFSLFAGGFGFGGLRSGPPLEFCQ